jgi:predicted AAA+ superfamily ATPase
LLKPIQPCLYKNTNPLLYIIDEVQYASEVFKYIKIYVDSHKKSEDYYRGFQKYALAKVVKESLAGRKLYNDVITTGEDFTQYYADMLRGIL